MDNECIVITEGEQAVDEKDKYINIIVNQTNYSIERASELWVEYNGDYIQVIKDYLNIRHLGVVDTIKKKSLNQQIYKHIRGKMNENMDVVISRMNGDI